MKVVDLIYSLGLTILNSALFTWESTERQVGTTCCAILSKELPGAVFAPQDIGYYQSLHSYWDSKVEALSPTCIFRPSTAQQVSVGTKVLVKQSCKFAIRGGGHAPIPDSANIDGGVTMDLGLIKQISLSADNTTAAIGAGARWGDVYAVLDATGFAVPGGRLSSVGVGGLTVGGGNSFFAARYGLVCDNVRNFEVVLASGEIVNANNHTRPDLFKALKGGSNNFGIVTRYDLIAFPHDQLWGGYVIYPNTTVMAQIPAFTNFTSNIVNDPYASLITAFVYSSTTGLSLISNAYEYTKPVVNPPIFHQLTSIKPEISNTMRLTNLSDLVAEAARTAPYGYRTAFATLVFRNDPRMLEFVHITSEALLAPLAHRQGMTWLLLLQPFPHLFTEHSVARGGNVLGLDRSNGDLILFNFVPIWSDPADDADFSAAAEVMISQLTSYAQRIGAYNEYVYLNYALKTQDPLRSYGAANLRMMRQVASKYDPGQVFQTLVPGGFKLIKAGGEMGTDGVEGGQEGVLKNKIGGCRMDLGGCGWI